VKVRKYSFFVLREIAVVTVLVTGNFVHCYDRKMKSTFFAFVLRDCKSAGTK
jgi:hypothetical protein